MILAVPKNARSAYLHCSLFTANFYWRGVGEFCTGGSPYSRNSLEHTRDQDVRYSDIRRQISEVSLRDIFYIAPLASHHPALRATFFR